MTNPAPVRSPQLYETENDITKSRRGELVVLLNLRLASAVDLYSQLKQAHWNVKGPSFIGLHQLFDEVAGSDEANVDALAERVVQLGGIAEGTVRVSAAKTRLAEYPLAIADGLYIHGIYQDCERKHCFPFGFLALY